MLGIPPGRDRRTDGQTDRIPIANTRSQQYLPVQLSRVKIDIALAEVNASRVPLDSSVCKLVAQSVAHLLYNLLCAANRSNGVSAIGPTR